MADLVAMGYPDETVAAPADEADLLARDLVKRAPRRCRHEPT